MKLLKTIGTLLMVCILSTDLIYAQDSTLTLLDIRKNTSPIVTFMEEFYSSPSLKSYERVNSFSQLDASYLYNKQDLFLKQEGSGNQGFRVEAKSYLKNSPKSTLWGRAYYLNEKIYDVSFNETNDYNLVYPYVMADTIGGDLFSETYFFSGGFAKRSEIFEYGFYASFRGVQSYRDRDPRPKNISSDIDVKLSLSNQIQKNYAVSLDLNLRKYNQKNELDFASELGAPLVFHDAGLGAFNSILAGNRMEASYYGHTLGGQLNLISVDKNGFIVQIGYNQFNFDKLLSGIIYPVGEAQDQKLDALIGYSKTDSFQSLVFNLQASHNKREGTEAKFNNKDSEVSIQKISEDIRYISDQNIFSAEAMYGRKSALFDWYLNGNVLFLNNEQNYISPDRKLAYSNLQLGVNITGVKKHGNALFTAKAGVTNQRNLTAKQYWDDLSPASGIFEMLNSNYQYLTSSNFQIQGKLRVDYQFPRNLNFFIQSTGNYTSYSTPYTGKQLLISTGFIF